LSIVEEELGKEVGSTCASGMMKPWGRGGRGGKRRVRCTPSVLEGSEAEECRARARTGRPSRCKSVGAGLGAGSPT
jgi:hypothetical protein